MTIKNATLTSEKNAKKIHGALSKNLNCEKNDSLTHLVYVDFLLPIVAIKQTLSQSSFVAKKH